MNALQQVTDLQVHKPSLFDSMQKFPIAGLAPPPAQPEMGRLSDAWAWLLDAVMPEGVAREQKERLRSCKTADAATQTKAHEGPPEEEDGTEEGVMTDAEPEAKPVPDPDPDPGPQPYPEAETWNEEGACSCGPGPTTPSSPAPPLSSSVLAHNHLELHRDPQFCSLCTCLHSGIAVFCQFMPPTPPQPSSLLSLSLPVFVPPRSNVEMAAIFRCT